LAEALAGLKLFRQHFASFPKPKSLATRYPK
jgi:hypothetical protein